MVTNPSNPFSTRFTRPGQIGSRDQEGRPVDIEALLERLRAMGGSAALVGPHGSGKSTLLAHLAEALEHQGRGVRRVRLRSWRDVTEAWMAIHRSIAGDTVCIDGWERVGLVAGGVLRLATWLTGCGLLVTAHRDVGLPRLVRCRPTIGLLRAIVRTLPGNEQWYGTWIRESDIENAFAIHGGNLRESLYELYDRFDVAAHLGREGKPDGPDAGDGCTGGPRKIHEHTA